jgi:hypothetical protein
VRSVRLAQQRLHQLHALMRNASLRNGRLDRAPGLAVVPAVAKATVRNQLAQFDKRIDDCAGRAVREPEHLHARRIDDPAGIRGQPVERGRRRRVAAAAKRL